MCELDIIFNFEKAYFILDEFIIGGEVQETSKKTAVKAIEESDMLQEVRQRRTKTKHLIFLHLPCLTGDENTAKHFWYLIIQVCLMFSFNRYNSAVTKAFSSTLLLSSRGSLYKAVALLQLNCSSLLRTSLRCI